MAIPSERLTHVELVHEEDHLQRWIRFGRHAAERTIDRRHRVLSFRPGCVFAFVRWRKGEHGTVESRIDICRTVAVGQPFTVLPFVRPGAEVLLRQSGWPKVERVLQAIDAVEALDIDACDAAPDHWQHVNNALAGALEPRGYSLARHRAWLLRRRLFA